MTVNEYSKSPSTNMQLKFVSRESRAPPKSQLTQLSLTATPVSQLFGIIELVSPSFLLMYM